LDDLDRTKIKKKLSLRNSVHSVYVSNKNFRQVAKLYFGTKQPV